jgi:hypothetical protein
MAMLNNQMVNSEWAYMLGISWKYHADIMAIFAINTDELSIFNQ